MHSIKALWFDLDDTLYDHIHSVGRGLDAVCETFSCFSSVPRSELATLYNRALNTFHNAFLRGEIDFAELRRRKYRLFCETALVDNSGVPVLEEFHRVYDPAYAQSRRATPGSIEMLSKVRESGMNQAIITNGKQETQEEKLRVIGLEWLIPMLVTSERIGVTKPNPQVYERALKITGHLANEVLMIGDSVENDIEAGLNAGLNVAMYAPGRSERVLAMKTGDVPVVREWTELFDLLGEDCSVLTTKT